MNKKIVGLYLITLNRMYADMKSPKSRYFVVEIVKCTGNSNCKSAAQIKEWGTSKPVRFVTLNSYFDRKWISSDIATECPN